MTTRQRCLIAAVGGGTPVLVNLLMVDMVTTLTDLTLLVVVAYLIRMAAMILVGALSGWLHEDETKTVKLFQLGMVAPAFFISLMNGAAVRAEHTGPMAAAPATAHAAFWAAVDPPLAAASAAAVGVPSGTPSGTPGGTPQRSSAAAIPPATDVAQPLTYPTESPAQQVARGLFGVHPERADCVLQVAALANPFEARHLLALYRQQYPSLPFTLFAPGAGIRSWLIGIGGQMTHHDAEQIQQILTSRTLVLPVVIRQLPPPVSAE